MPDLLPPEKILLSYNLYPKGKIIFGYEKRVGQIVGSASIIAKIEVPSDCGNYPDGWFPISYKSIVLIKNNFSSDLGEDSKHFIPTQILLDCYSYHWGVLQNKMA